MAWAVAGALAGLASTPGPVAKAAESVAAPAAAARAPSQPDAATLAARVEAIEQIAVEQLAAERTARSEAEAARERAEQARRDAERLARKAQGQSARDRAAKADAEADAADASDRANSAMAEADRLDAEAKAHAAEAVKVRATADALRQRVAVEARDRNLAIGLGVTGVLLAGLGGWLLLRRARARSRAAMTDLERRRPAPVSDCILVGVDQHVQLPGRQLPKAAGGVTVGRNPERSVAILNYEDVSRLHARFFHDGETYFVEDLGSRFGSKLDGMALTPEIPRRIEAGAKVELAEHAFEFRILG